MNEALFWVENASRLLMLGAGFGIAVHFHLMANFFKRAPHLVRWLAGIASFGGVGMIGCAASGQLIWGTLMTTISSTAVIVIYVAAWDAGVRVSEVFDRAAQSAIEHMGRTRQMVRAIADGADGVGKGLDLTELPIVTPSGWREVDASDQRAAERAGEAAP